MRHGVKKSKLGRDAAHRKAMLRNLAISILKQGLADEQVDRSVRTTIQKAKAVRSLVERLITYAKKGDLSSRRQAAKFVHDAEVLQELFAEIGPRYADRNGGYTRIIKLTDNRKGDNAEMAIIQLVEGELAEATVKATPVTAEATEESAE